jgi:ElaB/YqjD/DUF883 family membrane-anchored ribosome-binding protein
MQFLRSKFSEWRDLELHSVIMMIAALEVSFMKAENLTRDLRDNVAEIADRARDLSAKVKDRLDETYNDLNRTVRRAKDATEDRLDDFRDHVKSRPLASVATVAAGAFAIGILTGWLLGRKSRS